jgi:hypothetical protein
MRHEGGLMMLLLITKGSAGGGFLDTATSIVFLDTMYEVMELSRKAWAFMMRSMLADQPYSEVVNTQGESAIRELTTTFSTLSPRTSFINLVKGSNLRHMCVCR